MRTKFSGILTLLLAFVVQVGLAQEKTITGTVTDAETGMPLAGVNIVIEGTSTGTQTDFDGNYSLEASTGQTLVFTYLGYADKSVTVGSDTNIDVTMSAEAAALDQVVISVLGTERKVEEITTSTEIVQAEELTQASDPDVVSSLTGKISGLSIRNVSSGVNDNLRIVFRGVRSITGNNEALIVIDGVVSTAQVLQSIDPNSIASVNAIKGANGAALYGAEGANGVLVVTTKKGTADGGKLKIDISSSTTFRDIAYLPDRQTRYGQGWNGGHISYENGGWGAEFYDNPPLVPVGLPLDDGTYRYYPYEPDPDNIGEFFQTGTTYQNTFTISGGTAEKGYVFLTVNKVDKEFVIQDDISDKTSINFKGGKKLGKWTIRGNATYITQKTDITQSPFVRGGLYRELLQTATSIPVGEFNSTRMDLHWTAYYRNPNWIRENERTTERFDYFTGTAKVGYEINENINIQYNANIRTRQTSLRAFTNGYVDTENVGGGDFTTISRFRTNKTTLRNFYGDLLINFDYDLSDDFTLKATLGNNITDDRFTRIGVAGSPLTIPGFYNVDNIEGDKIAFNDYTRKRTYSFFGSANLGFRDYLYLNVTGRNDWTSVLAKDNRSFFYPSVGLSFIATDAFPELEGDVLNSLKVSGNYAIVGNAVVDAYQINDTYVQGGNFPYGDLNSFVPSVSTTDPNLQNETVKSTELNLNMGFFDNRLTLDVSVFKQNIEDQIVQITSSNASGVSSALQNIGETEAKGIEINLGATPIKSEDPNGFVWNVQAYYSSNETTVINVSDETNEVAVISTTVGDSPVGIFAIEGQPFPAIKGSAYARDEQGRVIIDPGTGLPQLSGGLEVLGYANPDYTVGLNTSFSYKGFRLSATMDYRTGHQFFSGTKSWLSWSGHLIESAVNGRSGFVYPNSSIPDPDGEGYIANTSVLTAGPNYTDYLNYFSNDYYSVAENFVLDATAFKLRELALSYSIPREFLQNTAFQAITLGVVGRNLLTVLPKENRGYNDPESSFFGGNAQGIALTTQYPITSSYGFTLNMTF